jgi:hypothetical protein
MELVIQQNFLQADSYFYSYSSRFRLGFFYFF